MADIFTLLLTLPLAPVRGLVSLAEVLRDEAERELYDPVRLRRRLEEVEAAVASGRISPEEGAEEERQILGWLTAPAGSTGTGESGSGTGESG